MWYNIYMWRRPACRKNIYGVCQQYRNRGLAFSFLLFCNGWMNEWINGWTLKAGRITITRFPWGFVCVYEVMLLVVENICPVKLQQHQKQNQSQRLCRKWYEEEEEEKEKENSVILTSPITRWIKKVKIKARAIQYPAGRRKKYDKRNNNRKRIRV